jgi:hypothetical protein
MFLGDFAPFPANCGTLSTQQNSLCSSVFSFVENDAQIYTSQRLPIEKSLLKKIGNGSYDDIKACKAFENLLISHKKYIVESLNKIQNFKNEYGELTTKRLNKDLRRHICCLMVNKFLEDNEYEIKQMTDEGDNDSDNDSDNESETENEEENNIFIVPEKEESDFLERCKGCGRLPKNCTCNGCPEECPKCLSKPEKCDCTSYDTTEEEDEEEKFKNMGEVPEDWTYADLEIHYRQLLFYYKEAQEELKGAKEIINADKELIKELKTEMKDDKIYINDYENNFNELLQKNKKLEKEIKQKDEEYNGLGLTKEKLEEKNKNLQDKYNKSTVDIIERNNKINELENKNFDLKIQLKSIRITHTKLKTKSEEQQRINKAHCKTIHIQVDENYKLTKEKNMAIELLPHFSFVEYNKRVKEITI